MRQQLQAVWSMIKLMAVMLVILSGLYPLSLTYLGAWLFPFQAQGSLIYQDHHVRGSLLLGQLFSAPHYFVGRPSVTQYQTDEISATEVLSWKTVGFVTQAAQDMVYPSASMLDPHISWQAMVMQLPGVAKDRKVDVATLYHFVETHGLQGGLVNVFQLNLAMDRELSGDETKA